MWIKAVVALTLGLAVHPLWAFDADDTAIVVVEFQNQWTEPGLYNRMIKEQYESRNVYGNTRVLLSAARKSGFPVIQAPLIIDPKNKRGWFAWLTLGRIFTKGSRRAEFTDGIVQDSDHIVTGRIGFDGFVGSDLDKTLKESGVKNLLFCGFTTEHCVDMTMDTAHAEHGYDVWLIPECTATKNAKLQRKTEDKWAEKGRVLPLTKALQAIERQNAINTGSD